MKPTWILLLACAWTGISSAQDRGSPAGDATFDATGKRSSQAKRPTLNFQVLESKRVNLGKRSLILNRVAPPILPEPPPLPPPPTAAEIAAAQAAWEREPHKKYEVLFLSATVYDHQVTEVRWYSGGHEFRIFTSIDFNNIRRIGDFETEDTVYSLMMGIGDASRKDVADWNRYVDEQGWPKEMKTTIPKASAFPARESRYMIVPEDRRAEALAWNRYVEKHGLAQEEKWPVPPQQDGLNLEGDDESFVAIDALHVYYDTNKERLIADTQKLKAANEAREKWLKEHPLVPKDTVINFWPKKSGLYLRKND